MKKYPGIFLSLLFFALMHTACNSRSNEEHRTANRTEKIIRNKIKTSSSDGLNVYQAFLIHQDGSLVGRDNAIKVGENAELRLYVRGWTGPDGIISLGASQNFVSDKGTVLWEEPDIFANEGRVTVDDAQVLRLIVNVGLYQPEIKHYTTQIKVWNKANPTQSVTAEVKFKIVK